MNEEKNFNFEETPASPEIQAQNTIEREQQAPLESIDVLASYEIKKQEVQERLEQISSKITALGEQLRDVRDSLGLGHQTGDVPSLDALSGQQEYLRQEQIKVSANYPGDWTLLLQERMLDPISKQKFIETRTDSMRDMKPGEAPQKNDGISFAKKEEYQGYYQDQIDSYDENVKRIFDSTEIGESKEYNQNSHNVGLGRIGFEGAVFTDGEKRDGTPLSVRQKNIIEAHEKGHGLRDFVSEDKHDFIQSIDLEVVRKKDAETGRREIGYLRQAEEIAERMAQLKNYFGMKARDIFTKEHLQYVRDYYLRDIKMDNNMKTFFQAITDLTIDTFIKTINKYPL